MIKEKFVVEIEITDPENHHERLQRSLLLGNLIQEVSKKFPLVKTTYKTLLVCGECGADRTHIMKDVVELAKQQKIKEAVQDLKTKPKVRRR